jgi:hypothetical protein
MEGSMVGIYSRLRHTDRASRKVRFACLEWSATNKKLKVRFFRVGTIVSQTAARQDERLKTGQTLSQKTRVQNTQIGTGSATRGRGLLYLRPSPAPSSEITTLWVEMCSYLPQEIVEQIVGTLCDDPVSLRTSALVCRSWVSASQEQIFHSISLTSTVAWKRLIDLLKNHPHIRPLLRRLEWSLRDSDSAPVLAHPAPQLFPRVDHLIYKDGLMTFVLLASLSSLAVLELREARFITLDSALANYIAGTPSGEDLPWPLGLRSVSIRDAVAIQQTCAERWIMCNVRVDMLRELTFCLPVEEQVPAMRQALGTLTALEHLTLVIEIHLDVAGELSPNHACPFSNPLGRSASRHTPGVNAAPHCIRRRGVSAFHLAHPARDIISGAPPSSHHFRGAGISRGAGV